MHNVFITRYMQTDNDRNSLTEHIQSIMQMCQIWNRANSTTFQNPDIKLPELSRTYIDFRNIPGPWCKGEKFKNFHKLSRSHGNHEKTRQLICFVISWTNTDRFSEVIICNCHKVEICGISRQKILSKICRRKNLRWSNYPVFIQKLHLNADVAAQSFELLLVSVVPLLCVV